MTDMTARVIVEATPGSTTITISTRRATRQEVLIAIRQTALFSRAEKIEIVSNKSSPEIMAGLLQDETLQWNKTPIEEIIAGEHVSKCRCSCGR